MTTYISVDGKQEAWIDYRIFGQIPEKPFIVLQDDNGNVIQRPGQLDWETRVKNDFLKKCDGYTETDTNGNLILGEYIPLKCKIDIHDTEKHVIVRQTKSILDALKHAAYQDDCAIAELEVERILDDNCYTDIVIYPAKANQIKYPFPNPINFDYFTTIKDTARSTDKSKKITPQKNLDLDQKLYQVIRDAFKSQCNEFICGDFEMFFLMNCREINKWVSLPERAELLKQNTLPITTPDADNSIYSLMKALHEVAFDDARDLAKFHVVKGWCNKEQKNYHLWIYNRKEYQ